MTVTDKAFIRYRKSGGFFSTATVGIKGAICSAFMLRDDEVVVEEVKDKDVLILKK